MTPHIQSWRTGRTWSAWHFFINAKAATALCGLAIPSPCVFSSLSERSAVLSLADICKSCLRVYALSAEGAPLKESHVPQAG